MEQSLKQLLLKDLCGRLPYGVFLKIGEYSDYILQGIVHSNANKPLIVRCNESDFECSIEVVRPYLRTKSSMTEEENEEYITRSLFGFHWDFVDWCNSKHFDYRGLIDKGLALEAPEGMYNLNEK